MVPRMRGDADPPRRAGTRRLNVPKASRWESYAEEGPVAIPGGD